MQDLPKAVAGEGSTRSMLIPEIDPPELPPIAEALPAAQQTVLPAAKLMRVEGEAFPHPPRPGSKGIPTTIENLEFVLIGAGIRVGFDVIKKRIEVRRSNGDIVSMNEILSLASLHGLSTGMIQPFVEEIAARHHHNPVKEWIESKPWDQRDRLLDFLATVTVAEGYPAVLKEALLYRWLLSAAAAAMSKERFRTRGVLTLQGAQGIGKTRWIASLVPAGQLRNDFVKLDHYLDGGNKDAVLIAIGHWIVELAEIEGAFRKEISRLKSFITNDCDKVRVPYGREAIEFDRRTVFAATVNDHAFLVDSTGNSRWLTMAVTKLNYEHNIDMQQLFAQLAVDHANRVQHWLTADEEKLLATYNLEHRNVSAISERVRDFVEGGGTGDPQTPTEILSAMGIKNPSNGQCRECGTMLRELIGEPKRIQGRDRWRIPPKPFGRASDHAGAAVNKNDIY